MPGFYTPPKGGCESWEIILDTCKPKHPEVDKYSHLYPPEAASPSPATLALPQESRKKAQICIPDGQIWLNEFQVAHLLGCSVSTLRQARCKSKQDSVRYSKHGRSVRYHRADVEAFMAAKRIPMSI